MNIIIFIVIEKYNWDSNSKYKISDWIEDAISRACSI